MTTPILSDAQIHHILEQVLLHQCACPSQLCKVILGLRELIRYEQECLDRTPGDAKVHLCIAKAAGQCEAIMNDCLAQVLDLEGWDKENLVMPAKLQEAQLRLADDAGAP